MSHILQAQAEWLLIDEGTTSLIREGIAQIKQATDEFNSIADAAALRAGGKPQLLIAMEVIFYMCFI